MDPEQLTSSRSVNVNLRGHQVQFSRVSLLSSRLRARLLEALHDFHKGFTAANPSWLTCAQKCGECERVLPKGHHTFYLVFDPCPRETSQQKHTHTHTHTHTSGVCGKTFKDWTSISLLYSGVDGQNEANRIHGSNHTGCCGSLVGPSPREDGLPKDHSSPRCRWIPFGFRSTRPAGNGMPASHFFGIGLCNGETCGLLRGDAVFRVLPMMQASLEL